MFGQKFATTNYGLDATGKGRTAVFIVAAILNIIAAAMAPLVLRPLRRMQIERG
jgi:HAMP domain-containing protein